MTSLRKPEFKKHSVQLFKSTGKQVFIYDVTGDGSKKDPFRYWVNVLVRMKDYPAFIQKRKGVLAIRLKPLPPAEARRIAKEQREAKKIKLDAHCTVHGPFQYPAYTIDGWHQYHILPTCPKCEKARTSA